MGEKIKLKIKFKIKGRAIKKGISCPHAMRNTLPKEIMMRIYKTVHAGQKSQAGGAREGFLRFLYRF
jgi:hypothetical protein